LPPENWWRLIIWLCIGFFLYFSYGRHHSVLAKMRAGVNPAMHGTGTRKHAPRFPDSGL